MTQVLNKQFLNNLSEFDGFKMTSLRFLNKLSEFDGSKSIPNKFLNLMLVVDGSRWEILTDLNMINDDMNLKEEYSQSDTEIFKLWLKLSSQKKIDYLNQSNKYNTPTCSEYCLETGEILMGECFFEFLEDIMSRQLLVDIFGEDLGGNHFWDSKSYCDDLNTGMSIYGRMDIHNKGSFEKAVERLYLKSEEKKK